MISHHATGTLKTQQHYSLPVLPQRTEAILQFMGLTLLLIILTETDKKVYSENQSECFRIFFSLCCYDLNTAHHETIFFPLLLLLPTQ